MEGSIQSASGTTAWYASQTFWGAVAAIGAGAGAAYASFKTGNYETAGAALTAMFGGLIAVFGRVKATKPLGLSTTASVTEKVVAKVAADAVAKS